PISSTTSGSLRHGTRRCSPDAVTNTASNPSSPFGGRTGGCSKVTSTRTSSPHSVRLRHGYDRPPENSPFQLSRHRPRSTKRSNPLALSRPNVGFGAKGGRAGSVFPWLDSQHRLRALQQHLLRHAAQQQLADRVAVADADHQQLGV